MVQSAPPGIKPQCQRCQKPLKDAELAFIEKKFDVAFMKFSDILKSDHDSPEHLDMEKKVLNRLLDCFTERIGSGKNTMARILFTSLSVIENNQIFQNKYCTHVMYVYAMLFSEIAWVTSQALEVSFKALYCLI